MIDPDALTGDARQRLSAAADVDKAAGMQAYMKTDMPFHGVQKPARTRILRELAADHAPTDGAELEAAVRALWAGTHREEKYLSLDYARRFRRLLDPSHLPLLRDLIVDGGWWDLVDDASTLVGEVLAADRETVTPTIRDWATDDDRWLRRTAVICQRRHREHTDTTLLFDACRANLADPDFFLRKAVGWALREHSKTDPEAVAGFVERHREEMSSLTRREATKYLP